MQKTTEIQTEITTKDVILAIAYANSHINARIHTILKPYNISSEQLNVLRALAEYPDKIMNMGEIQKVMFAKTSNTTRLVDKLVLKEYVERGSCRYNKRIIEVIISEKGLKFLNNIDKQIIKTQEELISKLDTNEKEALMNLLEKIKTA